MLDTLRRRVAGWIAPETRSAALGISPRIDPSGALAAIYGRPTTSGVPINEGTALGIAAVWSAVNLYASTIAALDLDVAARDDRGGASPAPGHWAYDLLRNRPNGYQPAPYFWETLVGHACTFGNGMAEIEWARGERTILGLHLMDPREYEPCLDDGRRLTYRSRTDPKDVFDASDVVHIRGFGFDGVRGYSPISVARETLGTAAAQQRYESALFGNGAQTGGHLEVPGKVNPVQQAEIRDSWNAIHQGAGNAGKVGILEGGMKWVQTSFSPADAEMILARGFSVLEVARLYRVPPHMLGVMEGATVGNAEQQAMQFVKFSLLPWLRRIEAELDFKLFGRGERRRFFARFDVRALERGDAAARSSAMQTMFGCGVVSENEWRLSEGMPALSAPQADWHWVPTNNLQPIETMPLTGPVPATQPASSQAEPDADDATESPQADGADG